MNNNKNKLFFGRPGRQWHPGPKRPALGLWVLSWDGSPSLGVVQTLTLKPNPNPITKTYHRVSKSLQYQTKIKLKS